MHRENMQAATFVLTLLGWIALGQAVQLPRNTTKTLFLDNGYDAGKWGIKDFCPEGSFATDIEVRYEKENFADLDETGVDSIKLYCSKPNDMYTGYITSTPGQKGDWQGEKSCADGLMTGMKGEVMPKKGLIGDNEGVINVAMECDHGTTVVSAMPTTNMTTTDWSSWDKCASNSAICGLEVRYQAPATGVDDVGVADFTMYCCKVPKEEK